MPPTRLGVIGAGGLGYHHVRILRDLAAELAARPTVEPREEHASSLLDLDPADAEPPDRALERLAAADLIIIGPGSLYTSVLPNLAIRTIADTIRDAKALRVYICNVMTQPNETDYYSAQDHLQAIALVPQVAGADQRITATAPPGTTDVTPGCLTFGAA